MKRGVKSIMREPYLNEEEKRRLKMCIANIKDKLQAIESESLNDKPYRCYLKEKIDSIIWDVNCIESMSRNDD